MHKNGKKEVAVLYQDFLKAINEKLLVRIVVNSPQKGMMLRKCIPLDYDGPRQEYQDGLNQYHFYDLDCGDGEHYLSVDSVRLVSLKLLDEQFEPAEYILENSKWKIPRDW